MYEKASPETKSEELQSPERKEVALSSMDGILTATACGRAGESQVVVIETLDKNALSNALWHVMVWCVSLMCPMPKERERER